MKNENNTMLSMELFFREDIKKKTANLVKIALKLEFAKYYKDSEMTAYISERSRNSK